MSKKRKNEGAEENSSHKSSKRAWTPTGEELFPTSYDSVIVDNITAVLLDNDVWSQFDNLRNEMIITKVGRKMFPVFKVSLSGLQQSRMYNVAIEFRPASLTRLKYIGGDWLKAGDAEPGKTPWPRYTHPDSPNFGSFWEQKPISFPNLKLTNKPGKSDQVCLLSLRYYQPVLVVETVLAEREAAREASFAWAATRFVAVTAYQNPEVTKLKIKFNPAAKSFQSQCYEAGYTPSEYVMHSSYAANATSGKDSGLGTSADFELPQSWQGQIFADMLTAHMEQQSNFFQQQQQQHLQHQLYQQHHNDVRLLAQPSYIVGLNGESTADETAALIYYQNCPTTTTGLGFDAAQSLLGQNNALPQLPPGCPDPIQMWEQHQQLLAQQHALQVPCSEAANGFFGTAELSKSREMESSSCVNTNSTSDEQVDCSLTSSNLSIPMHSTPDKSSSCLQTQAKPAI